MAVVVKFGAKWCGPCKESHGKYLEVQEDYKECKVTFYDVDIDHIDKALPKNIRQRAKIVETVPLVLIYSGNSDRIVEIEGWNEAKVRIEIEKALPFPPDVDYSVIKPGTVITSDNEDDVSVSIGSDDDFIVEAKEELEAILQKESTEVDQVVQGTVETEENKEVVQEVKGGEKEEE